MPKQQKKSNPYTKRTVIQARVDNDELRQIVEKAIMYCDGELSEFIRLACLSYRPLKKVVKNAGD